MYGPEDQALHIYTNLFDAVLANPNPMKALAFELLGFASGAKAFVRSRSTAAAFVGAWLMGHRRLLEHWKDLRNLTDAKIPASVW